MSEQAIRQINENCKQALLKSPYQQTPQMIVVTKNQSFEAVSKLYAQGFRHFAENRVDAMLARQEEFPESDVTWHLIGTLQTRKVKHIINRIHYFHALDRIALIDEIEKRAEKVIHCFLQVNIFQEDSKHGLAVEELFDILDYLKDKKMIKIVGLMTMAPFQASPETIRQGFAALKQQQMIIAKQNLVYAPCQYTSMGMSQDYQIALEEGATHLRVGSAFFT